MRTANIIDVDGPDFQPEVIERSHQVPVVVDFWAPWCGPCRTLGPLLEQLAEEAAGGFVLAKVNTDSNPELSMQFRIQGIPAVKVFSKGAEVDGFVGALPEHELRRVLAPYIPSPAADELRRAEQASATGDSSAAVAAYRHALELDPRSGRAWLELGRLLHKAGELDDALAALRRVPAGDAVDDEAQRLIAEIELASLARDCDEQSCRKQLEQDPGDDEARYRLGLALATAGDHQQALEQLLEVVAHKRTHKDDARKAMLKIFELVGSRSELAERFRNKLANALY